MKSFHPFRLDAANQCLWREDKEVSLTPKAFDVLRYLVEHAGRLVTQDELLEALWPETYVQPEVLRKYILEIRKALKDRPDKPSYVRTLPKRGYQFVAPVTDERAAASAGLGNEPAPELVGRDSALLQLDNQLKKALRGHRQIVFVTGEAGIGKTSLMDAFQSRAARKPGLRIARGQCVEGFGGKEAYYPLLEALGQLVNDPGAEELNRTLARQAPTWLIQLPSALKAGQKEALQKEIFGATRERMVREICEALEAMTAEHALLLLLEDLHWVDYSTLDVISALARRRAPARLLVACTYRPVDVILSQSPLKTLQNDLLAHQLCEKIALERLTELDVASYLLSRFPGSEVPGELAPLVFHHSGGNALFMVAIVEELLKKGRIAQRNHGWELTEPAGKIDPGVPETLHDILEDQFDQLSAPEQAVLRCASVAGERFSAWAPSVILDADAVQTEETCDRLAARQQFIRNAGTHELADGNVSPHYEFRHALYREFLYKRLPVTEKCQFHRKLAERMAALVTPAPTDLAAELALHFEEGRDFERALRYLITSSENLARRCAHRTSIEVLQHARELLSQTAAASEPELDLHILQKISDAHYALGDMAQSASVGEAVVAQAERSGRPALQVSALIDLSRPYSFLSPDRTIEVSERAAQIAAGCGDPLLAARAQMLAACWRILMNGWGKNDSQICAEAMRRIESLKGNEFQPYGEILYAHVLGAEGEYRRSYDFAVSAIPGLLESRNLVVYLSALSSEVYALLHMGRWGEALRVIAAGLEISEKNSNGPWVEVFQAYRSWLQLLALDLEGARRISESLLQSSHPGGLSGTLAAVIAGFAELGRGRPDAALPHFQQARGEERRSKFVMHWYWQTLAQLGLCNVWLDKNDLARARKEADGLLQYVLTTADPALQALAWEAKTRVTLASADWGDAADSVKNAIAILKDRKIPVVAWRVHATAAEVFKATNDARQAEHHRSLAEENIRQLAESFDVGEPLRESLLTAEPVRGILGAAQPLKKSRSRGKRAAYG